MFCSLRSQSYKMVKSPLFWFTFLWPMPVVAVFVLYYSVAPWSVEGKLSGYFQALAIGMPCWITLLCTYIAQQEERAGAYFNVLCIGRSRGQTFFALFIEAAALSVVGMVLASMGFYLFWGKMSLVHYVLTTLLMLIPVPCLVLVQLWIAFRWGSSWAAGTGMVFLLVGALGITGLFDSSWYYLPPIWAPRFVSLMISNVFHHENILVVAAEIRHGLFFCLIFSLAASVLVPAWFRTWEGRPSIGDE